MQAKHELPRGSGEGACRQPGRVVDGRSVENEIRKRSSTSTSRSTRDLKLAVLFHHTTSLTTTTHHHPTWATNRANALALTRPSLTHRAVASLTAARALLRNATVRAPLVVAAPSLRASSLLDQRGTRQLRRPKLQHVSMPSSARRRPRSMSTSRPFVQYGRATVVRNYPKPPC